MLERDQNAEVEPEVPNKAAPSRAWGKQDLGLQGLSLWHMQKMESKLLVCTIVMWKLVKGEPGLSPNFKQQSNLLYIAIAMEEFLHL